MAKDLGSLPGTQREHRAAFQRVNLYFPSLTLALCCPGRAWALYHGDSHSVTGSTVTHTVGPWLWLDLWGRSIMQIIAKLSVVSRRSWFTAVVWGDILHISFTALLHAICTSGVRSNLLLWLGREKSTSEQAMGISHPSVHLVSVETLQLCFGIHIYFFSD